MESNVTHILYVDDDKLMRTAFRTLLAPCGTLHEFSDPRDALAFLSRSPVEVIITDVSMPALPVDGRWFIAEVRKIDPHVEIIVTTTDETLCVSELRRYLHLRLVIKGDMKYSFKLQQAVSAALAGTRARRNAA